MDKYKRLILRTCIWFLLFGLPVSAFGADKVTLQLKWFHQFQFAGYYAAEQTAKMIVPNFIELGSFEASRFTKIAETYVALDLTDKISVDQDFLYASNKSLIDLTPEEQA